MITASKQTNQHSAASKHQIGNLKYSDSIDSIGNGSEINLPADENISLPASNLNLAKASLTNLKKINSLEANDSKLSNRANKNEKSNHHALSLSPRRFINKNNFQENAAQQNNHSSSSNHHLNNQNILNTLNKNPLYQQYHNYLTPSFVMTNTNKHIKKRIIKLQDCTTWLGVSPENQKNAYTPIVATPNPTPPTPNHSKSISNIKVSNYYLADGKIIDANSINGLNKINVLLNRKNNRVSTYV